MVLLKKLKRPQVGRIGLTQFKPMIRSRHPSHKHLRNTLGLLPFRSLIRLGSEWPGDGKQRVELNSVQSIKNSSSKLLMKRCFDNGKVKTADWIHSTESATIVRWSNERYPVIAKPINGSRGNGIELLKTEGELVSFLKGKNSSHYIFEKYYNFSREYRLHVTKDGCFYTCRKMLKSDVPQGKRFIRNDKTCIWVLEQNPQFNKPNNWKDIELECVKALKAVGLDIGGFDVRVQSSDNKGKVRKNSDFIVIESNSACSHGEVTAVKYREVLIKLLRDKKNGIQ